MDTTFKYFFILGLLIISSSCEPPSQEGPLSAATRTELDRLAADIQRDSEDKYHVLGARFVELFSEAVRKGTDGGTAEHIMKFASDNDVALEILRREIDDWYKSLPEEDRITFMLHLLAEDYPRQMRQLVPQLDQRLTGYEQAQESLNLILNTLTLRN